MPQEIVSINLYLILSSEAVWTVASSGTWSIKHCDISQHGQGKHSKEVEKGNWSNDKVLYPESQD